MFNPVTPFLGICLKQKQPGLESELQDQSQSQGHAHTMYVYMKYTLTHIHTHIVIYISVCYQKTEAIHKLKNRRMVKLNLIMHPMDW